MAATPEVAYVDTDVLIRLLTGDDLRKQAAAAALFERASRGEVVLRAPATVIADAVFVLSSPRLYKKPRADVRDILSALVQASGFEVENRRVVLAALAVFGEHTLDFGDAMLVAAVRDANVTTLYSYDADFDGVSGVKRCAPPDAEPSEVDA